MTVRGGSTAVSFERILFNIQVILKYNTAMDERLLSVNRVMHAMEELDHSELTRGDVKAASRAIDSMHSELKKDRGMDSLTDAFKLLLNMAERGNWTELSNARKNGKVKAARDEVTNLARFFTDNSGVSVNCFNLLLDEILRLKVP